MARHRVTFALPDLELGNADIHFPVKRSGAVLGMLLLSKGGVAWRPNWQPGRRRRGKKLRWLALDKVMREHGKPERRRRRKFA